MEKSLNKVELKGNVGQEPKMLKMENGGTVIRFSLATHESYKTKSGEWKEETTWHNIVAWASKGMPNFSNIKKGTFIELAGKIRYVKFKNQSGEERSVTEILALKIVIPLAE